jgi:hypothetical protein
MFVKKPHLRPKLVSESFLITRDATGSPYLSIWQQCVMFVKKLHLRPKLVSEFSLITRAATGSTYLSLLQQCVMFVNKPHLRPKLVSESSLITRAATGSPYLSILQQSVMFVKKPHLRSKLVSESSLITRAATGSTRLPGGPRLTDITLCLLFSFVVTQPNWKAGARRMAWPLRGRCWNRNATVISSHIEYGSCLSEKISGLSTDYLNGVLS